MSRQKPLKPSFQKAFAKAWADECKKPHNPNSPGAKVAKKIVKMWDDFARPTTRRLNRPL